MADETKFQNSQVPPAQSAGTSPSVPASGNDTSYAGPPKSVHYTTDGTSLPPHIPAHIGMLSDEEAEKEILDTPAKPLSLIDLIAEPEDNPEPKPEKKKIDFDIQFDPKIFKKYKDDIRAFFTQNPMIYKTFQASWMLIMTLVYLSGIAFFSIFFVVYFAFTPLLKGYLDSRGLTNVDFTVASHSLSELTISNIKDKQGLFKIKTIRFQYTFTNFLKGKITLADVDGLEIFIKQDKNKGYNLRNLVSTYVKLGLLDKKSPMRIQSLQFKNSKLFLGDKAYPIGFSGIGDLEVQRQFVIPLTFQNDYLSANASLTTAIQGSETTWTITLDNGKLSIPQLPAEMVSGTIVFKTRNTHLQNVNVALTFKQENSVKKLTAQLTPSKNGEVNVNMTLDFPNQKIKSDASQINVSLRNVQIGKDLTSLSSQEAMNIKLSNIHTDFLNAQTIQATLNGALDCRNKRCTFKQTRPSDLVFYAPSRNIWDTEFKAANPVRITLAPSTGNLFVLDKTKLDITSLIRKATINLTKTKSSQNPAQLTISLGETDVRGTFDLVDRTGTLQTSSIDSSWSDNMIKFEKARIETTSDEEGSTISLSTPKASLVNSDLLKIPFALELQITPDQYFSLALQSDNKQVALNANGYFSTFTGEILAAMETQPILFNKDTLQPSKITGLIGEDLTNVSGKVTCRGQIHWKNDRRVDGPMNVLFDNVSFTYGNVQVNKLNTVMEVSSFIPFGTKRNQAAFVESIMTTLPFNNVSLSYAFDASKKQFNISRMNLELAGITFRIDPTWMSYQSPVHTFLFKAKNIDMQRLVPYVDLDNYTMNGNISSASFSMQLSNGQMLLKNVELLIPQDGLIRYTPPTFSNPGLAIFKNLSFRKATVILNELTNKTIDFLFIGDSTNPQDRRKTTIRFNITEPLLNFIKPKDAKPIPQDIVDSMKQF